MRKLLAAILCLMVVLFLFSCGTSGADHSSNPVSETDVVPVLDSTSGVFTFPEGCVVGGIDLKGMLGVNAYSALREAAERYVLKIEINDRTMILWADEFELTYSSELMQDYVNALKEGKDPRSISPFTYNKGLLRHLIATRLFELPTNPALIYNTNTDSYDFADYVPGSGYDLDPVMAALDPVILSLEPKCSIDVAETEIAPAVTAESESGKKLLAELNTLLTPDLFYSTNPQNPNALGVTFSADTVSTIYTFDEDLNPVVNKEAIYKYAEEMSPGYTLGTNDGKFLNSLGEYVDLKLNYAEEQVDVAAWAADIAYCFENNVTGTRKIPYKRVEKRGYAHDLNGTYVEINLTEQRLWVYENFQCVLYTPIVTGNLSEEWDTPTGVYSVYQKIYPTKAGRVFRYWMPFLGAYGLHDANWRSEFRTDEHLFEGSHGCVNIPPENFLSVYKYVDVGTPVIIYGGTRNNPVTQVISGTSEYNVGVQVGSFALDATPKYGTKKDLYYSSDNPEVATVSKYGVVTVHATGTARITATSIHWNFCPATEKVITVKVHEDCSEVGHMIVDWKTTKAATCKSTGTQTGVCTSCDYSETRTISEVHDFYFPAYMHPQSWVVTKWPTCSEAGSKYRKCSDCGYTETVEIPAIDHVPSGWNVTKLATATESGVMTGHCYFCGLEATKEIPVATS